VGEMAEAVRRAGGEKAYRRIEWKPDPVIQSIVDGWPRKLRAEKAPRLGIAGDASMDELVAAFIEDDLPAQKAMVARGRSGRASRQSWSTISGYFCRIRARTSGDAML